MAARKKTEWLASEHSRRAKRKYPGKTLPFSGTKQRNDHNGSIQPITYTTIWTV